MKFKHFLKMAPAGEADGGGGGDADAIARGDILPGDGVVVVDQAAIDQAALDQAAADKVVADQAAADQLAADQAAAGEEGDDKGVEGGDDKGADASKPKKDTRIPLARHKELMDKGRVEREALEAKLAKYEGGAAVAATNEQIGKDEVALIELEQEHAKLVVDGNHAKAAETMTKIRRMERGIIESKSQMATEAAEARAIERVRYDTTCDRLELAYPVLDPKHDDYDKAQEKEVVDLSRAYQTMGMTPSAALQKAAKTILGAETTKQAAATDTKPKVDPVDVAKQLAEERRQAQVKKNLAAHGQQPVGTKGVGADSDKAGGPLDGAAVLRMDNDKFSKLDEATLSRLRGDTI